MGQFAYQAIDKRGNFIQGVLEAESQERALGILRTRGLYPARIEEVKVRGGKGRATGELATMILLLGKLLGGGLPLDQALELLAEETGDPRLRQALSGVLEAVRAGSDLAGAMAESQAFPSLVVEMVRAGEASGQLATVLHQLALYLAAEQERQQEIKSALLYPALLLLAAVGSTAFLFVFLLPRLAVLFADFGQELPATTKFLVSTGTWLSHAWPYVLAGIVFSVFGIVRWLGKPEGQAFRDELYLRLPALGPIFIYTYTARLANTFAILLRGGVPLADAFPIVQAAVGNTVYKEILATSEHEVKEGQRLAESLSRSKYMPKLATAMIAAGEETGSLGEMLEHLSETYQYRAELGRKSLLSLLEPAIILIMGLLVGFVVVSVLLPIFDLSSYIN
jgi:type IV pilus assembly protein PilC